MAGGISVNSLGGQSAIGTSMGGGSQIVGGKLYNQYSPQWYDAMRQNESDVSGAAGKAAGTYTNSYLNAIPSLSGLSGGATAGTGTGAFGLPGAGAGTAVGGAAATSTGAAGGPVSSGGYVPSIKTPDMTASNDATFAAAKDKVGQLSRASLDSLSGELGSQGMLGGGAQAQATRDIISSGQGQLGDVARGQAETNAATNLDLAKTGYTGAIEQRGQDINAQEANARLALEQRQQNFQLLNMLLSGLGRTGGAALPTGGSSATLY